MATRSPVAPPTSSASASRSIRQQPCRLISCWRTSSPSARCRTDSRSCDLGRDLRLTIPSPLHLVAMKLHALRNPARFESGIDLQDVKHLIRAAQIDIESPEFQEIAQRYATEEIRSRLLEELERESGA